MSADNGIYIGQFRTWFGDTFYVVSHAAAIENTYAFHAGKPTFTQEELKSIIRVYGNSLRYNNLSAAYAYAVKEERKWPRTEYGIVFINYGIQFPSSSSANVCHTVDVVEVPAEEEYNIGVAAFTNQPLLSSEAIHEVERKLGTRFKRLGYMDAANAYKEAYCLTMDCRDISKHCANTHLHKIWKKGRAAAQELRTAAADARLLEVS